MKMLVPLIGVLLTSTAFEGLSRADDKREATPRFKGVELHSWKSKEGGWLFVLLDGTNRQKTQKEIEEAKNQIKGTKELKKALTLLAEGESVTWSKHRLAGFAFPAEATNKEIEKAAKEAKVNLTFDPQ